jgi:hypothetical protein
MSAIPSNLYTAPKVKGLTSVKTTSISLRPVNASTSTEFSHDNNNIMSFHIPAYANSYISPKSTFLSMIVKAAGSAASESFKFNPGYPVFERLQIKASSGAIICDIDDYHVLQKLSQNFDPDYEGQGSLIGDYRTASIENTQFDNVDETELNTGDGVTIQHNILAGIFDQEHYIPVGLFSGSAGHALEINFYLTKPYLCMSGVDATDVGACSFTLSNPTLQLELVQLPQSVNDKLNAQLMKGDKISIPMVNWRSHKSYISSGSKSVDITISESAHDLEAVMTVLLPNSIVALPNTQTYGDEENVRFLGGLSGTVSNGSGTKVVSKVQDYQFNYADRYFPAQKCELKTKDQRLALMHAVKNLDLTGKSPYVLKPNEWTKQFCIVQSFKTSKEDDFENGMNTSSSGAPLILQLSLDAPLAAGTSYRVVNFVKQNQTLNIFKGGYTSLTDGMAESQ